VLAIDKVKGIVHPKITFLSLITHAHVVHLQTTNQDIFDDIQELSDPTLTATQLPLSRLRKAHRLNRQVLFKRSDL